MFSIDEIGLLIEALNTWEKNPNQSAFSNYLVKAMLLGPQIGEEGLKKESDREFGKSKIECESRSAKTTKLKAKLYDMQERLVQGVALDRPGG